MKTRLSACGVALAIASTGCAAQSVSSDKATGTTIHETLVVAYDFEHGYFARLPSKGPEALFRIVPAQAAAGKFDAFFRQSNLARMVGKTPYCDCVLTMTADGIGHIESAILYAK